MASKEKDPVEFVSSDDDDDDSLLSEDRDEDLKARVLEVLKAFDQNGDNTIEASDIGNVYRCLLINITQEQLAEIESLKTDTASISCDVLLPRLLSLLQSPEKLQKPPSFADMEAAFRTILDQCPDGLTKEKLIQLMGSRGEPLNDTELGELVSHLPIRKNKIIDWKAYCRDIQLTIQERQKSDK